MTKAQANITLAMLFFIYAQQPINPAIALLSAVIGLMYVVGAFLSKP